MLKSVLNACNDNHNLVPRVPLLRGGKKRDPGNEYFVYSIGSLSTDVSHGRQPEMEFLLFGAF